MAKNSCPPLEGRVPEGRVRWTNGREVYTGAGADKAVFEALPKQFVSPNSPRLARRLFERRSCPAFIRHEQASYRRASRLLRAVLDETNFLRRHSEKTDFTDRRSVDTPEGRQPYKYEFVASKKARENASLEKIREM